MSHRYRAVLFDLLSALIDSWRLWDDVAGGRKRGRRWRLRYLEQSYECEGYPAYETLIIESAADAGITLAQAAVLIERWDELTPWPEARDIVAACAKGRKVGVVTNCSETLGTAAAQKLGLELDVFLTAERAGCYKPDPAIYAMAIREIGERPEDILYVAGSPFDVRGAVAAGMSVYWHNRVAFPSDDSPALEVADTLHGVYGLAGGRR
ncbi:MAG: HAD-IA family hydrolase [Pseudomonadota bacterium]